MVPAALSRARCSAARAWSSTTSTSARRASAMVSGLLTMPLFNWGRTQAINEIAEADRREALLRYEDGIVRALEDVENALVALRDERQRAQAPAERGGFGRVRARPRAIALRPRPDRPAAAARRAAHAPGRARRARTTAARNCCSTASSSTRRSAAAGKPSSPSPLRRNRRENLLPRPSLPHLLALAAFPRARRTSRRPKRCARCAPSSSATTRRSEANRYFGTVQARHEVDQAFRVGGKVASRKVDVGQSVREGDVLAVLDDTDYRLAEEAARQQLVAATAQARQAESDRQRLEALKGDGSVSASDDEQAQSARSTTQAAAEAEARKLELARNRLKYTVLRASQSGVVTAVRFEVGQVVAEGQPVVSIADRGRARDRGRRAGRSPRGLQDVAVQGVARERARSRRSTSCCASSRRRRRRKRARYRARLKPVTPRPLPLGATATLVVERTAGEDAGGRDPGSAITQSKGQPAVWVVRRAGAEPVGTVELIPVVGARLSQRRGARLRAAGRRARRHRGRAEDGARIARRAARRVAPQRRSEAGRAMKSFNLTEWALEPPRHRAVPDPRDRHRRRAGLHASSASSKTRTSPCRR